MSNITRRDFINGTLMATGSVLMPFGCKRDVSLRELDSSYYPPALTGMRGSHPGSNEHAHTRAWTKKSSWGTITKLKETYDLVVVGGGISGLSAAYFYQQRFGRGKKVLILDNHDDFGGHAKRNEHTINGNTRISYGGSQSIVEPNYASKTVLDLFQDIGIDLQRFNTAYNRDFYKNYNLGAVTYFNKKIFGQDKIVKHPYCNYPNYVEGLLGAKLSNEEAAQQAPLSKKGQEQLLRVLHGGVHLIDVPKEELAEYIATRSYFDYLKNTLGVDDPLIWRMARHSAIDWANSGTDLMSIAVAKSCGALGFAPKAIYDENNPYIYHFPDGNAGIARALVKNLIPDVSPGENAEELVTAKFNYGELDRSSHVVKIRLNSTVIGVKHAGPPEHASEVLINYINHDKSYEIRGRHVIMACYNMMIPHIVQDLPSEQTAALRLQMKSPLIYSSIGLHNWKALKEMGIGLAMSPGNWHQALFMDFPVSMDNYQYTQTPSDPCVLQMISCPYGETIGAPRIEQYAEARHKMLTLQFKDYENEIRSHLSGMLPQQLFDFDRDVASITVNRWGHGYTVGGPGDSTRIGRQPFGRITIANCDSGPGADVKTAIDMASRAVDELT